MDTRTGENMGNFRAMGLLGQEFWCNGNVMPQYGAFYLTLYTLSLWRILKNQLFNTQRLPSRGHQVPPDESNSSNQRRQVSICSEVAGFLKKSYSSKTHKLQCKYDNDGIKWCKVGIYISENQDTLSAHALAVPSTRETPVYAT